jgi:hypothetical protein
MLGRPIILKLIEYKQVMVRIPDKRAGIFEKVCNTPVNRPAKAPAIKAATMLSIGPNPR